MQAIVTTYAGPTNTLGSRIIAKADAGRVTVSYNPALGIAENHAAAALYLLNKVGWTRYDLVSGSLPGDNGYCHVLVVKS